MNQATTQFSPRTTPRPRRRRGLSLVEVMISLTISTFLLVAVAAAYNASAAAVEINDKFFRASQAARVTLNQVLTEIRRAESVLCSPDGKTIYVTRPADVRAVTDEETRQYRYDAATRTITVQIFYDNGLAKSESPLYTLARNIEAGSFGPPDVPAGTGKTDARVPVTVEVKIGSSSVRLNGSSTPRLAMKS